MSTISVVVGAQNGSEGKGTVAGELATPHSYIHQEQRYAEVYGVRVGGPNAGHTIYGRCYPGCDMTSHDARLPNFWDQQNRHPWKLRQIPVAAVTNPSAWLVIAEGSEIDLDVLAREITELDMAGYGVSERLMVDAQATILERRHIEQEEKAGLTARLGSTAKGIGAARADRIWRTARLAKDEPLLHKFVRDYTGALLQDQCAGNSHIIIEGTQGYDLGLHAGNYPYCTSGNARAIDFLAQTGLSPWAYGAQLNVWAVARTKPIRVAGNSGPLTGETSWDELGLPPERTTVTNKVRRVGGFDLNQVARAIDANGGDPTVRLALLMVDYDWPDLFGQSHSGVFAANYEFVHAMERLEHDLGVRIRMIGTSPVTSLAGSAIDTMWTRSGVRS